jgi:hypothetical protein
MFHARIIGYAQVAGRLWAASVPSHGDVGPFKRRNSIMHLHIISAFPSSTAFATQTLAKQTNLSDLG